MKVRPEDNKHAEYLALIKSIKRFREDLAVFRKSMKYFNQDEFLDLAGNIIAIKEIIGEGIEKEIDLNLKLKK